MDQSITATSPWTGPSIPSGDSDINIVCRDRIKFITRRSDVDDQLTQIRLQASQGTEHTDDKDKKSTAWKLLLDSVDMIVHEIDTLSESNMLQGC